ncbi:hypothetical protein AB0392_06050 [Nonomuraea angiospora]|uniref:hypothetical protein n=1 Tax=Nonomuraea angiospora TaxID=46172 RepID=UPI00344DC219
MTTTTTSADNVAADSPVRAFRVAVRDDHDVALGHLNSTTLHSEAREMLARVQRIYPRSILQALLDDGDLGTWRDVTEDDLDRIAEAIAARTLVYILTINALPRISWMLNNLDPGKLSGSADAPEQVSEYASMLGLELQETESYGNSTLVCAKGAFQGVDVRVSCYRRPPLVACADIIIADPAPSEVSS